MNELLIYALIFLGGLVVGTAVTIIITRISKLPSNFYYRTI